MGHSAANLPPPSFVTTTAVDGHHGWIRVGFALKTPDGVNVNLTMAGHEGHEGLHVGQLAADGRRDRIVPFSGLVPSGDP